MMTGLRLFVQASLTEESEAQATLTKQLINKIGMFNDINDTTKQKGKQNKLKYIFNTKRLHRKNIRRNLWTSQSGQYSELIC